MAPRIIGTEGGALRDFAAAPYRPYSGAMEAPSPSAVPSAASRAPLHIGGVGMMVRDLDRLTAYYRDMLGSTVLKQTPQVAMLGAGGVPLLELIHKFDALPDDPREAGLYHTAFLMPTRADLARWILHVAKNRVPITGASDHHVSEAIYLDDPEGNGVEVYFDRLREKWRRDGDMIFQKTDPLDVDAIIRDDRSRDRDLRKRAARIAHRPHPFTRWAHRQSGKFLSRRAWPRCDAAAHRGHLSILGRLSPPRGGQHLAQQSRGRALRRAGGPRLVLDGNQRSGDVRRTENASRRGRRNDRRNSRGLCRDRPLGHPHPFHHCALNAARNVCADVWRSPFGDQATLSGRFEGESRLEPKPPEWAAGSSRQVFSPEF